MLNFVFHYPQKVPKLHMKYLRGIPLLQIQQFFRTHPDIENSQNRVIPNHISFNFPYKLQNVNKKLHNSASEQSFTHLVIIFLVFSKCTQRVLAVILSVYVFAICRTYLQTGQWTLLCNNNRLSTEMIYKESLIIKDSPVLFQIKEV
jgi:hypothetical protein